MTEEVTGCKICAERFGIRWVPPQDYYNYVCPTLPKRARKSLWRRLFPSRERTAA